ncbi:MULTISPECIES: hypothetical protein [unclassified Streptomyces]|uniref:hypothetical protein n=1 Tax=unclassified Streptomyces TaxID=2593676 RepID=UPI0013DC378B|nr:MULTISPECIES: hypothetical protein [unclassified Streptomyces]NMI58425.1 hypothetical protein [Streptomyces sp. RLA2-12]
MTDMYEGWQEISEKYADHLDNGAEALPTVKMLIDLAYDYLTEEDRIELARFTRV